MSKFSMFALSVTLLAVAAGGIKAALPQPMPIGAGADWSGHGGAADEAAFSRLDQINTRNVGTLGLAWSLDLPNEAALEATPVAANGVLYFTGSHAIVYAVDAVSGKLLWTYDPQTWKVAPDKLNFTVFPVNRGVAYADGRVFGAALDGRLFALDAKTGAVLWTVATTPARGYQTITGAPRTFNGKVIIGHGGADIGTRGYVTAYDQATGRQIWRFYTVPGSPEENKGDPVMERAAATWKGEYWKSGTGAAVWDGITFDPELNRIYLGTANGGPQDPDKRSPGGGDTLYASSIIALDADTGKYVWHYQINPRDGWDYDCTQQMTVATLDIKGKQRKVLMQAPKNGFFYVLDRATGKLISAEKYGKATWAERIDLKTGRPVEMPNIRYESGDVTIWPSSVGAHNWQSMSFNPKTGLVYIPSMQLGMFLSRGEPRRGAVEVGGVAMDWVSSDDPADGKGTLVAWDPVRQQARWRVPLGTFWNGGTLSTAGNLVFQGTADGFLAGYDAASGERLWRFYAGLGIIAAPMSYSVGGKQYISILVGYGSSAAAVSQVADAGWKYGVQPRRLLTFELGGTAALPPTPPPTKIVNALDDPSLQLNDADVAKGARIYARCMGCHGRNVVGVGGSAPDLRESAIALNRDAFWTVLHEGSLIERGMPGFSTLSREQVMQIYAYIRSETRRTLHEQNPAKH